MSQLSLPQSTDGESNLCTWQLEKISIPRSPGKGGNLTSNEGHYCAPKVYLAVRDSLAVWRGVHIRGSSLGGSVWGSGYFSLPLPVDWCYYHVSPKQIRDRRI